MMNQDEVEFQRRWANLLLRLKEQFGEALDLEAILFLIGIQELGKGPVKLSKREKLEVLHIAVCALLVRYNYYRFVGRDEDGWPHFEATEMLPSLKPMQQHRFIKEAILEYFENYWNEKI
ncbi:MAG: hypothetical protein N2167_10310 [Flavobacteriales bacterium]|nr:hypothetical protein [Flavobacteriales bacterium]